jgi:hypothetical protein
MCCLDGRPPSPLCTAPSCKRVRCRVRSQMRHQGVGVPYVADPQLVTAPRQCRNAWNRLEQPPGAYRVVADHARADVLVEVRDTTLEPPSTLVTEGARPSQPTGAHRSLSDDAADRDQAAPHRRHLDHVAFVSSSDLQRGVEQRGRRSVRTAGGQRLVDTAVPTNEVAAGAERKSVESHDRFARPVRPCRCHNHHPPEEVPALCARATTEGRR